MTKQSVANLRAITLMLAILLHAVALLIDFSQSFAKQRHLMCVPPLQRRGAEKLKDGHFTICLIPVKEKLVNGDGASFRIELFDEAMAVLVKTEEFWMLLLSMKRTLNNYGHRSQTG